MTMICGASHPFEIRFHLITPANFEALKNEFLPSVVDVKSSGQLAQWASVDSQL